MMLSRIADNMFWMNRYMERVDGLTRALRYYYILGFDKYEEDNSGYTPILQSFTHLEDDEIAAIAQDTQKVLCYLITDTENIGSVKVMVGKARENARGSQDKITKEVWEHVNALYHYINKESLCERLQSEEALEVLDDLERFCLMYSGILDSTMPRGLGWQFMNFGKFIERSLQTVDMLDAFLQMVEYNIDNKDDLIFWRRLLFSLSGYELYLKTNRGTHHTRQVIHQVIFDEDFSRSIMYCLVRLDKYLNGLLEQNIHAEADSLHRKFGRLKSLIEFADPEQVTGEELRHLLDQVRLQMWGFSAHLSKLFFSYS